METEISAIKPPNPFNPGSPVDPNDFVGRIQELENFRQRLRQTVNGSLASMAIAGGYGVGKTSFLHKCNAITEEQNALPIYFSLNEIDNLTKESLARTLIQRVKEKIQEEVILQRISGEVLKALSRIRIKTEGGIEVRVGETQEELPNLQTTLRSAWGSIKKSKKAIVFLIDEAHVLEKKKAELLLFLRAVLEQLQLENVPVMIVPAGKFNVTGPGGTGFSPLVRTFPPVALENFTREESKTFILKKLQHVNLKISEPAIIKVYETTEGHPYVLTAYLWSAYSKLKASEKEISEDHLKATDIEFATSTLARFFSRFYDQVGKQSKGILFYMAKNPSGESSLSELCEVLSKANNELSPHLAKLVQDGAIVRIDRGRYKFFHRLLGKYIMQKGK